MLTFRLAFLEGTRRTGNDFSLKGGLIVLFINILVRAVKH